MYPAPLLLMAHGRGNNGLPLSQSPGPIGRETRMSHLLTNKASANLSTSRSARSTPSTSSNWSDPIASLPTPSTSTSKCSNTTNNSNSATAAFPPDQDQERAPPTVASARRALRRLTYAVLPSIIVPLTTAPQAAARVGLTMISHFLTLVWRKIPTPGSARQWRTHM